MYRVLAVIFLAYAVCFPKLAAHVKATSEAAVVQPAEPRPAQSQNWLKHPIARILAALQRPRG